jgi:c-di-GMP-binding flagellar brake protein YcgR
MEKNDNINRLLDVSRGGIAVNHNNTLKVGDVIPVHLTYGDLDIQANAKVVSATTTRAGAEFVDIDQGVANQLLYLNMLLERNAKQLAMAQ